jgi:recombination protein RecA
MHDHGISREGDLLDLGLEDKIIDKSGAWISYGEMRLGQGRENAKQYLRDNPPLVEEISKKILDARGMTAGAAAPAADNGQATESPAKPEQPTKRRGATVASEF